VTSILGLRDAYPELFPLGITWYLDEPFAKLVLPPLLKMPRRVFGMKSVSPDDGDSLTDTVLLAQLYVQHPESPIWQRYLWTADTDSLGQRVYVGDNGLGFEIHRHIHLTERFGVPIW